MIHKAIDMALLMPDFQNPRPRFGGLVLAALALALLYHLSPL